MKRTDLQRHPRSRFAALAQTAGIILVAASAAAVSPRSEVDLTGPGWRLWLDREAHWERDELFVPPVDLAKLPVNPPTGGWDALNSGSRDVAVPGTVEEYLHPGNGPSGDLKGVSWWIRRVKIPEANTPRRLLLQFDSVRLRAEVFVNHKLVGYDLVGNSPFEVDITGAAAAGSDCELAVRVTDPGGNFDWRDSSPFQWGTNLIPMSHGFGGITGRVKLISCDPVYVDDIYVQNTPAMTNVNVIATFKNMTGQKTHRSITFEVAEKSGGTESPVAFHAELKAVDLDPGDNVVRCAVSVTNAHLWDLSHPNLYVCRVHVTAGTDLADAAQQMFGFRWFAPEGIGSNALFRLNGKRIVLRTAISWGFWPINGIYPTADKVESEIQTAKALGLTMLNFHRAIGHPELFDRADELGLLYYEEPGAYANGDRSTLAKALAREKLLRMVRRDRSHPSLVIYNMINEAWDSGGASRNESVFQGHVRDMKDAHALDPSRTITHTSAWAVQANAEEKAKMNMRPFDDTVYLNGWFDTHHAGGPEVWRQNLYQNPDKFYNRTTNRTEIVYWGEEGAISSPPRLEKIKVTLDASPQKGWDAAIYLDWYQQFDDFLTRKNLRSAFPTVDALTRSMGAVSHYHQGRKIETLRINDAADGYAVNGWEAESVENHSGIVDCFRNPKADPAIMAYYNQPLYVAVKTRSQFAQIPGEVGVDFYAINERDLHGEHTLKLVAKDPAGKSVFTQNVNAKLTGGDVYGELLAANVRVPIAGLTGMFHIEATLVDAAGRSVASGRDEVLAVDWRSDKLAGSGATWESSPRVRNFLQRQKQLSVAQYRDDLGKLDWVVVTRPPAEGEATDMMAEHFESGLTTTFYSDAGFSNEVHRRVDKTVDYQVPDGAAPDQHSSVMENYGVRWDGKLRPPVSGEYTFVIESSGGVRLWIDGRRVLEDSARANTVNRVRVPLQGGQPAALRLEFSHRRGNAQCKLLWAVPEQNAPDAARLMDRVRNDGTLLLLLDRADTWMDLVQKNTAVTYRGSFKIGTAWLGGLHFVKEHALFKDLPTNTAMDWPYQAVVRDGKTRSGLRLEGEELVAGAWHSFPMDLGTAVAIIPCGKGKIIVSTLEIVGGLDSNDTSTEVSRKLLCNFIGYR